MIYSTLSFYKGMLLILLLSTSVSFAELAFAASSHSYTGNQGQGVGNVAPGNPGNGPNATTAGKAGINPTNGGGSGIGGVTPSVPTDATHNKASSTSSETVGALIESGVLSIMDDEQHKHKKPKKKKDKKEHALENVVNTNNVKEVTGVEKTGQEVVLKSGSNENNEKMSGTTSSTTTPTTIPVQIITSTNSTTEQPKVNEFTSSTIAQLLQNHDIIILSEDNALLIPVIDAVDEYLADVTVVDLRKKLAHCYFEPTDEDRTSVSDLTNHSKICQIPQTQDAKKSKVSRSHKDDLF